MRNKRRRLPPPWLFRGFGTAQRTVHRLSGGRLGLSSPRSDRWGEMCLMTVGRRSGRERSAILGYLEDGANLVTIPFNGWSDADPAWWHNLRAHPDAVVRLKDETRPVRARAAEGDERKRLWALWRDYGKRSRVGFMADIDSDAARLSREMAVVVLEPRSDSERDTTEVT
jgi:deazaflavin-dependent oxidoreductase (nitroreductase family)